MGKSAVCPGCGLAATRKNGRDRRGRRVHQCCGGLRRLTLLSTTPFLGYRFPLDSIALAVRRSIRAERATYPVAVLCRVYRCRRSAPMPGRAAGRRAGRGPTRT